MKMTESGKIFSLGPIFAANGSESLVWEWSDTNNNVTNQKPPLCIIRKLNAKCGVQHDERLYNSGLCGYLPFGNAKITDKHLTGAQLSLQRVPMCWVNNRDPRKLVLSQFLTIFLDFLGRFVSRSTLLLKTSRINKDIHIDRKEKVVRTHKSKWRQVETNFTEDKKELEGWDGKQFS